MSTHWFVDDAAYEARVQAEVARLRRERDQLAGTSALPRAQLVGDHPLEQPVHQQSLVQQQEPQQPQAAVPANDATTSAAFPSSAFAKTLPARVQSLSVNSSVEQDGRSSRHKLPVQQQSGDGVHEREVLDAPSSPDEPLIRLRSSQAQKGRSSPSRQPVAAPKSTAQNVPKPTSQSMDSEPSKLVMSYQRWQHY